MGADTRKKSPPAARSATIERGAEPAQLFELIKTDGRGKKKRIVEIAVPMIDDAPLFARMEDRYAGLPMSVVDGTRHLVGAPTYGEHDVTVLLDGTYGHAGCCGVMAVIDVLETRVVWRDFFAHGSPDLPPRLHFEFDRHDYEAAVAQLPDVPELDKQRWPLEP